MTTLSIAEKETILNLSPEELEKGFCLISSSVQNKCKQAVAEYQYHRAQLLYLYKCETRASASILNTTRLLLEPGWFGGWIRTAQSQKEALSAEIDFHWAACCKNIMIMSRVTKIGSIVNACEEDAMSLAATLAEISRHTDNAYARIKLP